MKISEAFNEFRRREIRAHNCSVNTDKAYQYTANIVIWYYGDINIRRLNADNVADFYLAMIEPREDIAIPRHVSKDTARKYISNLKCVIRFCRKCGIRVMNPDDITIPKAEKKFARYIDVREYHKFLAEAGKSCRGYSLLNRERNVLMIKFLFCTGLRVGEMCALNRDSIRDRQFTVVGKSKEPRLCFITKDLEIEIDNYLSMREDNNPALFISNENGKRITPDGVQRVFRRVSKATNMAKVTPHTMRHSFATKMLEDGTDIRYVAAFLGHQNITTTERYTHIRDIKLRQIYTNVMENC